MKKVIAGKAYNTETAVNIGSFESNINSSHWTSEKLYRKKTGEFFIHGEGGTLTQYAQNIGNNQWTVGEKIIPISYEVAEKWTQKHLDSDVYQSFFGDIAEDDTKKIVGISIRASTHEKIKKTTSMKNISISEYIENLVLQDLSEKE